MKFKVNKNNPHTLFESSEWHELYGNKASIAADLIDEILKNEKADLSPEEKHQLEIAYRILFDCAPHLEENLKEAANGRVTLHVEFYPYERYSATDGLRRAKISGVDKLDALKKLVDRMGLYLTSDEIEEEGYTFEDAIESIISSNGDGCDFITALRDSEGNTYIEAPYDEEEEWDIDESINEARDVNLSDKSNSISGLLLAGKDRIDSATSQQELIKVCSELLADKGGAKAQQFLAVLKSKKGHYNALKYVYDFILAGEGMRSPDSQRKSKSVQRREALQLGEDLMMSEDDLIEKGFQKVSGRKGYDFYRKLVDGKGKWYAVKDGEVMPITYDQARGYEPLDSVERMAMTLGGKLLPRS